MIKDQLRIVFMGTPEFAVACLKKLVEKGYKVVGVITAPDRPAGRGRKLNQSAVKTYALKQNLKVLQPKNLKDPKFIEELKELEANLQIVVAFRMLPKQVWQLPKYGTFNLHASLLPHYRGAAPIHWAIINGETQTGLSTFFIDEKIDTGQIIMQEKMTIEPDETVGELHDRMMTIGAELIIKTVESIKNETIELTVQTNSEELKTAYKLDRDNTKINWKLPLDVIYNKIRGLNPFPSAWSQLMNGEEVMDVKIYAVTKERASHNEDFGHIFTSKTELKVAVKDGYIRILELQLPGKRKMDVQSLLNGFHFEEDAKML